MKIDENRYTRLAAYKVIYKKEAYGNYTSRIIDIEHGEELEIFHCAKKAMKRCNELNKQWQESRRQS